MTRGEPGVVELSWDQLMIELDMRNVKILKVVSQYASHNNGDDSSWFVKHWKNEEGSKWLQVEGNVYNYIRLKHVIEYLARHKVPEVRKPFILVDRNSAFYKFTIQFNYIPEFVNYTFIDARSKIQALQGEIELINELADGK